MKRRWCSRLRIPDGDVQTGPALKPPVTGSGVIPCASRISGRRGVTGGELGVEAPHARWRRSPCRAAAPRAAPRRRPQAGPLLTEERLEGGGAHLGDEGEPGVEVGFDGLGVWPGSGDPQHPSRYKGSLAQGAWNSSRKLVSTRVLVPRNDGSSSRMGRSDTARAWETPAVRRTVIPRSEQTRANSAQRRLLPTPAAPTTPTPASPASARANAVSRAASSSCRPTRGDPARPMGATPNPQAHRVAQGRVLHAGVVAAPPPPRRN